MMWLRLSAALLLLGAAAGPWVDSAPTPAPAGADVVILVDRTTSMAAQDYNGNQPRMDGVANDLEQLAAAFTQARITVVTADNEARIAAPWTTDASAIVTLGRTMGWREEGFGTGSDISVGVPLAEQLLRASATGRPDVPRYFFYLGDGEQTSAESPASFAGLADVVDGAWVLGYGTSTGGVMARRPDTTELVTHDGVAQRSHIDETALRVIAAQAEGTYLHRSSPSDLALPIQPVPPTALQAPSATATASRQLLPIGAAVLVVIDVAATSRRARQLRRELA